jgi:WD40 repeat protein
MTNDDTNYVYDVFISYTFNDRAWVNRELLGPLEAAGLRVCIDYRDFAVSAPILDEIERAIHNSRKTVLVFSSAYLKSNWTQLEQWVLQTVDPANRERRFVVLLCEPCEIPARLQPFIHVDFSTPERRWDESPRLFAFLGISSDLQTRSGTLRMQQYMHKAYQYVAQVGTKLTSGAQDATDSSETQPVEKSQPTGSQARTGSQRKSGSQQPRVSETPIKDFLAYAGGLAIFLLIVFVFMYVTGRISTLGNSHISAVRSLDFALDGQTLASGSWDGTAKVWSLHDNLFRYGIVQHTLGKHQNEVESVAFSPNGRWLASGSRDSNVRIWDANNGSLRSTLPDHTASVKGVTFSHNGEMVTSASADDTIILWDVAEAISLKTLYGHTEDVESVAFSPTGKTLASGSADDTIILWSVAEDITLCTLTEHTDDVNHVTFSPNGDLLASASADNTIILWRVRGCEIERVLSEHTDDVESVAFSPDGHILASGSEDRTVRLWRVADGELLETIRDHRGPVYTVAFSPDGTLASGSSDKSILLHETENYSIQAQSTPETSHQMVTPIVIPDQRKQP